MHVLRKYISLLPVSRFHSKACWMRDSSYNLQGGDAIAHRRPPLDNARQLKLFTKAIFDTARRPHKKKEGQCRAPLVATEERHDMKAAAAPSDPNASSSAASASFAALRKRLATEDRPAGLPQAVVVLNIGDERWLVDLREGLTPDAAVRKGDPDGQPDVKVTISPSDFQDLIDGKLTAFKAVMSKRLVVQGDMKLVRSLGWLWEQPADAPVPQERGAVRVRVISAKADGDHGLYALQVEERGCLLRRWRDQGDDWSASESLGAARQQLPLPSLPPVRAPHPPSCCVAPAAHGGAPGVCVTSSLLACSSLGPRHLPAFSACRHGTLHGAAVAGRQAAAYVDSPSCSLPTMSSREILAAPAQEMPAVMVAVEAAGVAEAVGGVVVVAVVVVEAVVALSGRPLCSGARPPHSPPSRLEGWPPSFKIGLAGWPPKSSASSKVAPRLPPRMSIQPHQLPPRCLPRLLSPRRHLRPRSKGLAQTSATDLPRRRPPFMSLPRSEAAAAAAAAASR